MTTTLGRWDDVPDLPLTWTKEAGPYFGNALAQLTLDDRSAELTLWHSESTSDRADRLDTAATLTL